MQKQLPEQGSDAVRRYYAAFPALKKGKASPLPYYMPPPSWCRKPTEDPLKSTNMQRELSLSKDWNLKNKRFSMGKERRNSYHGQKKNSNTKKRCHSYSKSFEMKENLPEWVTNEGVWDMETQDPIKEFIKAIAFDEGYGTCENTVTDEIRIFTEKEIRMKESAVPDLNDDIDLDTEWVIGEDLNPRTRTPMEEELYAKFEAKFDRSIEALWSKDQANTPDDECQELPIDFHDLLSSPSDRPLFDQSTEKCSLISISESIWSNDAFDNCVRGANAETPTKSVEVLHDRFKPLNLADELATCELGSPQEEEPFSLYNYEDIYEAVPCVASVMRSLTALNHSKSRSSFTEVIPRRPVERLGQGDVVNVERQTEVVSGSSEDREDLLTSTRTHFRPIRKDCNPAASSSTTSYVDGATFDINGELDPVTFCRSESGSMYLESEVEPPRRYYEYRASKGIDYGRLNLTEEQREANSELVVPKIFTLKFRMCQIEKSVQTDESGRCEDSRAETPEARWTCDECSRIAGAKKMRQSGSGLESIWSESGEEGWCQDCAARQARDAPPAADGVREEWSREWEELLSDISYAHAMYAAGEGSGGGGAEEEGAAPGEWWRGDRKRRHSATVRCGAGGAACPHPHAPFLHCCVAADRPLTR